MPEDFIRNTPQQIPLAGNLAAGVRAVGDFASKPFGYDNPPGRMAFDFMGGNSLAKVLESVAYGDNKALENSPEGREARMDIVGALPLATGLGVKASKTALRAADKLIPEAGQLNMFIGPSAKTADLKGLTKAQEMEASAASPDQIWKETGWFKGKDDKWRSEISDHASRFTISDALRQRRPSEARNMDTSRDALGYQNWKYHRPDSNLEEYEKAIGRRVSPLVEELAANYSPEALSALLKQHRQDLLAPASLTLRDVLQHKELYDAYPELADMPYGHNMHNPGYSGHYEHGSPGKIAVKKDDDINETWKTTLHEVQHAVQHKEGFDPGANPDHIKAMKDMPLIQAVDQHEHSMNAKGFKEFLNEHPGINPEVAWDMVNERNAWWGKPPTAKDKDYFVTHVAKSSDAVLDFLVRRDKDLLAHVREKMPPITKRDATELYMQDHGEVESRATESRAYLRPSDRKRKFPLKSYDRPYDKLKLQKDLYDPFKKIEP